MKRPKFQYHILNLRGDMIITIKCLSLHSSLFRRIFVIFTIISLLLVTKTNAQDINSDTIKKGSDDSKYTILRHFEKGDLFKLIISGDVLYGLENYGGKYNGGRLFKINTDGSDYQALYDFSSNAYKPGDIVISDSVLYGITTCGGYYDDGVLFKFDLKSNGPWTKLYDFDFSYFMPYYDILISDGIIFGTALAALSGTGCIFKINKDGTGYKILRKLNDWPIDLLFYEGYLYGITWGHIFSDYPPPSTLFKIKTDGTEYSVLHTFSGGVDGSEARCNLVRVENKIYSLTKHGGSEDAGIVYCINTDGTGFENLFDLPDMYGAGYPSNNIWNLVYSDPYLYGTQGGDLGGSDYIGLLFKGNEENFEILWQFNSPLFGYDPSDFVIKDGVVYGTTMKGGFYEHGVIYKYKLDDQVIQSNILKLSIKRPEQITINTKDNLVVEKDKFIDLDTTFSVAGNIQYTHSWKVKTNSGYDIINKIAKITGDSTFYLFVTTIQGCSYLDSVMVQATTSTGIHDFDIKNQINIYPNPNTGDFQIKIPDGYAKYSYDIFDVLGVNIANGSINCPTEECIFTIKLTNATPGVYNIIIKKDNKFYNHRKFIISK